MCDSLQSKAFLPEDDRLERCIQIVEPSVQWHFNPPAGSQCGGSWEWLILSVIKTLTISVKEKLLNIDGHRNLICEAEAVINYRPISKASEDLDNLEALTLTTCFCSRLNQIYHQ